MKVEVEIVVVVKLEGIEFRVDVTTILLLDNDVMTVDVVMEEVIGGREKHSRDKSEIPSDLKYPGEQSKVVEVGVEFGVEGEIEGSDIVTVLGTDTVVVIVGVGTQSPPLKNSPGGQSGMNTYGDSVGDEINKEGERLGVVIMSSTVCPQVALLLHMQITNHQQNTTTIDIELFADTII